MAQTACLCLCLSYTPLARGRTVEAKRLAYVAHVFANHTLLGAGLRKCFSKRMGCRTRNTRNCLPTSFRTCVEFYNNTGHGFNYMRFVFSADVRKPKAKTLATYEYSYQVEIISQRYWIIPSLMSLLRQSKVIRPKHPCASVAYSIT